MFEKLLSSAKALRRHQDGPFAIERERYLQHCSDTGATYWSMRIKCNELLWAARLLDADAKNGVDMAGLVALADRRMAFQNAPTTRPRFIDATRPWLRFLGWWRDPIVGYEFQEKLEQYCVWMRDERGLSASTIVGWRCRVRDFLIWCKAGNRELQLLRPSDIEEMEWMAPAAGTVCHRHKLRDTHLSTLPTAQWPYVSPICTWAALIATFRRSSSCLRCEIAAVAAAIRRSRASYPMSR